MIRNVCSNHGPVRCCGAVWYPIYTLTWRDLQATSITPYIVEIYEVNINGVS